MEDHFAAGDRVQVSADFFWAKGATGTISLPPSEVTAVSGAWRGNSIVPLELRLSIGSGSMSHNTMQTGTGLTEAAVSGEAR
jgi:hypothetical protein